MTAYLKSRENKTISTKILCDLASIVLKENCFELSNQIYHQELETAIGTKFVPLYANLFMAGLEKRILEYSGYHPYFRLGFLDSIFCIWTDGLEKLQKFFKFLNAFHPRFRFTMDYSHKTKNFLDAQVFERNPTFKQTCTVKTQIDISTDMQNHATDIFTKSIYHLAKQYVLEE